MKKGLSIAIVLFIVFIMYGLIGTAIFLTNKYTSDNRSNVKIESTPNNLFYQYSDTNNIFSWNIHNGKNVSFDSTKSGYIYYTFNDEDENKKQNQLLISKGDFHYWFRNNSEYSSNIFNGKVTERELDLGNDLRNKWGKNNTNYPASDIKNKYNIARRITLYSSDTGQDERTEHYSSYMDIYVNSNNKIIYALPKDIDTISYVTEDEVNTDAVQENKTTLVKMKYSNINNIIDSLDEPNYAIVTNNYENTKLTYVWYIFDNYYFYYTMQVDYYVKAAYIDKNTVRVPLAGSSISDSEYGIVNKDYIYYTNNELAKLFDGKEKKYNTETWITIDE